MNQEEEKIYSPVDTPTTLQMEAVECGAASLTMIMGYYKKYLPLSEVRVACGVSRDGSKASNIAKAAVKYGLKCEGYRQDPEDLINIKPPMIIHWNFNHFIVFEGISGDKVYLNDPAEGKRVVTKEELDRSFTGIVLTFEPTESFKPGGRLRTVWDSLKERLEGIKIGISYVFLAGISLIVPGIILPNLSRYFVDRVLVARYQGIVYPLLAAMLFMGILEMVLSNLQIKYLDRLRDKISITTSAKFVWHILQLPMKFFYQRYAGDIENRIYMNQSMADILSSRFASAGVNIFQAIFYMLLMVQYSWVLTLVGITISLINLLFLRYISKLNRLNNVNMLQESGKLASTSITGIRLIESIKANGGEASFFSKWAGHHAKLLNFEQSLGVNSIYLSEIPSFLGSLNSVIILSLGSYQVLVGGMTIGELVGFQVLIGSFMGPVTSLISFFIGLKGLKGSFDRLDDVLESDIDPMFKESSLNPSEIKRSKLDGYVEMKNVSFGYSSLAPPLISNFDLNLNPGDRVALVGMSGSGKSTITKVVSGLYKEWEGDILFDGVNRKDLPKELINNSLSVIDQEVVTFEGTIRDNIKLWDKTISDEDMIKACKDAFIHDAIVSRKEGYDFILKEESSGFSGGQLQRLEIARVLATNPSIIIMDEATSALDTTTEKMIDANIRKRGCTTIIVAHRLSTIRDSDEIIVLNRGKVEQRGTHDELKDVEGLYSTLIHSV